MWHASRTSVEQMSDIAQKYRVLKKVMTKPAVISGTAKALRQVTLTLSPITHHNPNPNPNPNANPRPKSNPLTQHSLTHSLTHNTLTRSLAHSPRVSTALTHPQHHTHTHTHTQHTLALTQTHPHPPTHLHTTRVSLCLEITYFTATAMYNLSGIGPRCKL